MKWKNSHKRYSSSFKLSAIIRTLISSGWISIKDGRRAFFEVRFPYGK
jgi:hypothetical protein